MFHISSMTIYIESTQDDWISIKASVCVILFCYSIEGFDLHLTHDNQENVRDIQVDKNKIFFSSYHWWVNWTKRWKHFPKNNLIKISLVKHTTNKRRRTDVTKEWENHKISLTPMPANFIIPSKLIFQFIKVPIFIRYNFQVTLKESKLEFNVLIILIN